MDKNLYTEILDNETPNHYQLLGLQLFENDIETIHKAGLGQMKKLKAWDLQEEEETGKHIKEMHVQLSRAIAVLEGPEKKEQYDKELAKKLGVKIPYLEDEKKSEPKAELPKVNTEELIQPELSELKFNYIIFCKVIVIILLLVALNPSNPYGYYIFLRWVCCISYGYLAYKYLSGLKSNYGIFFIAGAIVYNPIVSLHFSRSIWGGINIVSIVLTAVSFFYPSKKSVKVKSL